MSVKSNPLIERLMALADEIDAAEAIGLAASGEINACQLLCRLMDAGIHSKDVDAILWEVGDYLEQLEAA